MQTQTMDREALLMDEAEEARRIDEILALLDAENPDPPF